MHNNTQSKFIAIISIAIAALSTAFTEKQFLSTRRKG